MSKAIHILNRHQIDVSKWDAAITKAHTPLIYALSWYLDIVSPGWQAMIYKDYEIVMPLTYNYKMGLKRLLQPQFAQQLGVFSAQPLSAEALKLFIKQLPFCIKTDIHLHNKALDEKSIERNNFVLDLQKPYSEIQKQYSKNTKRNIKRAQENSFEVFNPKNADEIIACFKQTKAQEIKLKPSFYKILKHLIHQADQHNALELVQVNLYNDFAAGIVFTQYLGRYYFLFSSTSAIGKSTSAMPYLIDQIIQEKAQKATQLDFEGSDQEGLARFYAGFGAQNHVYQRVKRVF